MRKKSGFTIVEQAIALPLLKQDTKLPVIMNQKELKELFAAPTLLKQRIVLTLIYSAGLRGQEVINLKISDIDFERKTIHIRQSKYKKDRVVPLAESMAIGLKKYLSEYSGLYCTTYSGLNCTMDSGVNCTTFQKSFLV